MIFGHTHRAGPLPRDDVGDWRTPEGSSLVNTGCWVHERAFLGRDASTSPYRPRVLRGASTTTGRPVLPNVLDGVVALEKAPFVGAG